MTVKDVVNLYNLKGVDYVNLESVITNSKIVSSAIDAIEGRVVKESSTGECIVGYVNDVKYIKLLKDIHVTQGLSINDSMILDLSNHVLEVNGSYQSVIDAPEFVLYGNCTLITNDDGHPDLDQSKGGYLKTTSWYYTEDSSKREYTVLRVYSKYFGLLHSGIVSTGSEDYLTIRPVLISRTDEVDIYNSFHIVEDNTPPFERSTDGADSVIVKIRDTYFPDGDYYSVPRPTIQGMGITRGRVHINSFVSRGHSLGRRMEGLVLRTTSNIPVVYDAVNLTSIWTTESLTKSQESGKTNVYVLYGGGVEKAFYLGGYSFYTLGVYGKMKDSYLQSSSGDNLDSTAYGSHHNYSVEYLENVQSIGVPGHSTGGAGVAGYVYARNCKFSASGHGGVYVSSYGVFYAENCIIENTPYSPMKVTGWAGCYLGYGSVSYINNCKFKLYTGSSTSTNYIAINARSPQYTRVWMSNCKFYYDNKEVSGNRVNLRTDYPSKLYLGEGVYSEGMLFLNAGYKRMNYTYPTPSGSVSLDETKNYGVSYEESAVGQLLEGAFSGYGDISDIIYCDKEYYDSITPDPSTLYIVEYNSQLLMYKGSIDALDTTNLLPSTNIAYHADSQLGLRRAMLGVRGSSQHIAQTSHVMHSSYSDRNAVFSELPVDDLHSTTYEVDTARKSIYMSPIGEYRPDYSFNTLRTDKEYPTPDTPGFNPLITYPGLVPYMVDGNLPPVIVSQLVDFIGESSAYTQWESI